MAVMYSKLGGCLGETAKLGHLARTDLCTWVKGLLDKLMTHLGLGSSKEEPWGLFALLLLGGSVASMGASATCLGSSTVLLGSLECPKPGWVPVTPDLNCYLPAYYCCYWGKAPASWEPALLVAWEVALFGGGEAPLAWKTLLSTWEIVLSAWEALSLVEHLTA